MGKTMETQDVLLRQNRYFYNHTPLELAYRAEAEEFASCIAVQTLLTDIWHGKINPFISSFRILTCMFCWPLVFILKIFRYDIEVYIPKEKIKELSGLKSPSEQQELPFHATDLPFRVSGDEFIGFRLFYFLNAPIIKYVYHFLMHILMLLIFAYLILFDLWPLPMTQSDGVYKPKKLFALLDVSIVQMPISEIFIMLYMIALFFSELREVYFIRTFSYMLYFVILFFLSI